MERRGFPKIDGLMGGRYTRACAPSSITNTAFTAPRCWHRISPLSWALFMEEDEAHGPNRRSPKNADVLAGARATLPKRPFTFVNFARPPARPRNVAASFFVLLSGNKCSVGVFECVIKLRGLGLR